MLTDRQLERRALLAALRFAHEENQALRARLAGIEEERETPDALGQRVGAAEIRRLTEQVATLMRERDNALEREEKMRTDLTAVRARLARFENDAFGALLGPRLTAPEVARQAEQTIRAAENVDAGRRPT